MEKKSIGAFLAVLRKANGLTQQQVADRLNVSNKTVSKWERDESLPDITLIPALAEMFSVTSDEILRGQRMEQKEAAPQQQERQAEKARLQARALIARTLAKHLNWMTGAAAMLAAGMIALFTVSYAFYKPVLGFGIFMILEMSALVMEFLSVNTARTALTGGDMVDAEDALAAEKEVLTRTKGLISAAAALLVWALPLVLIRSDLYADSVVDFSTYLMLVPILAAVSALVYMLTDLICRKIWPELRIQREEAHRRLRRLYIAAGSAMTLVLLAAFAMLMNRSSTVTTATAQTIEVWFEDEAAYREFEEMAEDCEQDGAAWLNYCWENLAERGIPWKGEITDFEKDHLIEYGYLTAVNEIEVQNEVFYRWAFYPGTRNSDDMKISFEMEHYEIEDSGTQFGILLGTLLMAAVLLAAVILRRKYILQESRIRELQKQAMAEAADDEPEAQEDSEE